MSEEISANINTNEVHASTESTPAPEKDVTIFHNVDDVVSHNDDKQQELLPSELTADLKQIIDSSSLSNNNTEENDLGKEEIDQDMSVNSASSNYEESDNNLDENDNSELVEKQTVELLSDNENISSEADETSNAVDDTSNAKPAFDKGTSLLECNSLDESIEIIDPNTVDTDDTFLGLTIEEKLLLLRDNATKLMEDIDLDEFESYYDYYLINSFKKGRSSAGMVDLDSLRKIEHNLYYNKIQYSNDIDNIYSVDSNDILERNQSVDSIVESKDTTFDADYIEEKKTSLKSLQNSQAVKELTKIPQTRRMTRLQVSQREHSLNNIKAISSSSRLNDDGQSELLDSILKPISESLVQKVKKPYRRSDWLLPNKFRYTRERNTYTKPSYEVIKINELIDNDRLKKILSRFDGGLAGVYKRNTNNSVA